MATTSNNNSKKKQTLGHRIKDFLFTTHTSEKSPWGSGSNKEKMTKEDAIKCIEDHWSHPFQANAHVHNNDQDHHDAKIPAAEAANKENTGSASKKMTKEETLHIIEEHWKHPFQANAHDHHQQQSKSATPKKEEHNKDDEHHNHHHHRTLGARIKHFLLDAPTEKSLGLPAHDKLTKEQALAAIEEAWERPLHPRVD